MENNTFAGSLNASNLKIAIVAGRFNEFITDKLISGARDAFIRHQGDIKDLSMVWVPGAYEIPLLAKKLAKTGKFNAIVGLGAVIRGDTPHFEYVASEVTKGIASVALETEIPVILGVLTTDNVEQAIERAGTKAGNYGFQALVSAIEMSNLIIQCNEI